LRPAERWYILWPWTLLVGIVATLAPVIRADDGGLVCVLQRGVEAVVVALMLTAIVVVVFELVIFIRLVAALARVGSDRR
jgi:multisubunit Na+/H+ antiporter MnhC subunit